MPSFLKSLFGQVMVALVLGVVAGFFWPDFAASMKPLGDGFIKLIKMIIAPLVFGVVVPGIASAGDLKKVGRVGVKSIIYFEIVTTIALILGIVVAYAFGPGHGMNVDTASLDASAMSSYVERTKEMHGTVDFLLGIVPSTFVGAFADGDILQVLVLAVLFGAALSLLGERAKPVTHMIELTTEVLFRIIGFIVRLAPARRLRRHRLHCRPVRRRLAPAARDAGPSLLPHRHLLRVRHPRRHPEDGRLLDLQVPRLPA